MKKINKMKEDIEQCVNEEHIREWLRSNVTPILDCVMKENDMKYTVELRCNKCGGMDGLRFRWEYVDEKELTTLTLCHDGWGLRIVDSIVGCENCGIDKPYSDEDFLVIKETDEVVYMRESVVDELIEKHTEELKELYIGSMVEDAIMYVVFSEHMRQSNQKWLERHGDKNDKEMMKNETSGNI